MGAVALAVGCARPASNDVQRPSARDLPQPVASSAPGAVRIDPNRVNRVRGALPPGYEAGSAEDVTSPAGYWGFRARWTAEPQRCELLVSTREPRGAARGLSASGPGGILYVAVVAQPEPVVDSSLLGDCSSWTMSSEHSSAAVRLGDAPQIEHARTTGMTATIRTVVESGTETTSTAHTYCAYADGHLVFVVLVTDPGAVAAPLAPQFAADLLVKSVAALRA